MLTIVNFLVDFDEPTDPFVPSGQAVAGGLIESPFFDRIGGRGKTWLHFNELLRSYLFFPKVSTHLTGSKLTHPQSEIIF